MKPDIFITLFVMASFCFVIYRRKIRPFLKVKDKPDREDASGTDAGLIPPSVPGGPSRDIHREVYLFDSGSHVETAYLEDKINTRLALIESEMNTKGYAYDIVFSSLGVDFLIILTYRI